MIPWQISDRLRKLVAWPQIRKLRASRAQIALAEGRETVIGFGGVLEKSFIHGGAVKLLSLRDFFYHHEREFHILYLVSSALPDDAEALVDICQERGIRFVWNQNGVAYPAWAGAASERYNGPMRRLRAKADFVVNQSEFCRACADRFLGPISGNQQTLFNPVNLERFCPVRELPGDPVRLLAAGTHGYRERVTRVLEALEILRNDGINAVLTLAGKMEWPGAQAEVSDWIGRRKLPVFVRPAFTQEEAVKLYQTHHILIHPKYMDPCPTVVAEALACGLPVVGSDSGGMPEMVSGEAGSLIPVPEIWDTLITPSGKELADGVKHILSELQAHQLAARNLAESMFDREQWLAQHKTIFETLQNG